MIKIICSGYIVNMKSIYEKLTLDFNVKKKKNGTYITTA